MKKFLENLKPANTYICFTHCDQGQPTEKFKKEKIKSLKTYGELEIPEANVIFFDNTKESLKGFVERMAPG
jgi:hypothetical protein